MLSAAHVRMLSRPSREGRDTLKHGVLQTHWSMQRRCWCAWDGFALEEGGGRLRGGVTGGCRLVLEPGTYLMGAMGVTMVALLLLARTELRPVVASDAHQRSSSVDGDTAARHLSQFRDTAPVIPLHRADDSVGAQPAGGGGGGGVRQAIGLRAERPARGADSGQQAAQQHTDVLLTAAECPVTAVTVYRCVWGGGRGRAPPARATELEGVGRLSSRQPFD